MRVHTVFAPLDWFWVPASLGFVHQSGRAVAFLSTPPCRIPPACLPPNVQRTTFIISVLTAHQFLQKESRFHPNKAVVLYCNFIPDNLRSSKDPIKESADSLLTIGPR